MMLTRIVLFLFIALSTVQAESNTTREEQFHTIYESDNNHRAITDQDSNRSGDTNTTQELNSTTTAAVLQSETAVADVNVTKADANNTNLAGLTTKLDDVTALDIVKEQRKQRNIERKVTSDEPDKPRRLVDTIVVKGSVLQGKIAQLTSEYISFRLIYGEGSIRINYRDVESLMTEHEYNIYFDGKETQGYITGIKEHAFLKIQHGEIEELITISKIDRFVISEREDASFENKLRNIFPYWSGNMDLGIEYERGTNIKNKLKIGGHVERKRMANKTIFDITYSYEATETIDTPKVLNKHELYTFLEHDYFLNKSHLLFAEIGYDFDVPRGVDNRIYPSFGYGYRLQAEKKRWVQLKLGSGYVYETFIDYPSNEYMAGFLGIDIEYEVRDLLLLNRILFGANFFYMPGSRDMSSSWLLRYSGTAEIPVSKALSLKVVARQVSDDNPSPEVGDNKFTFDLYLSLRF